MNGTRDPRPRQKSALPVKAGSGRKKRRLTQERVRELFDYREDGRLVWTDMCPRPAHIGKPAGSVGKNGYWLVGINNVSYCLHRIIFLYHYGYMPESVVDHIDRNPSNNRIENLREVSHICNGRNCDINKNSKTGVCGVCWHKRNKKWHAQIMVNYKRIDLGRFDDFTDAVKARHDAEVAHSWNGCNSTSSAYLYLKERGLL